MIRGADLPAVVIYEYSNYVRITFAKLAQFLLEVVPSLG